MLFPQHTGLTGGKISNFILQQFILNYFSMSKRCSQQAVHSFLTGFPVLVHAATHFPSLHDGNSGMAVFILWYLLSLLPLLIWIE